MPRVVARVAYEGPTVAQGQILKKRLLKEQKVRSREHSTLFIWCILFFFGRIPTSRRRPQLGVSQACRVSSRRTRG